ncbi:MAG TPA: glycosyltransferase family 2 protein [Candidatus Dormibacteraeota bacterium]|nr:glycosyltransferase family 2 protein [Candidatus Dormibacteraeota bacterium]
MKLAIFIPCLNEEKTLGSVLATIPKKIPGVDQIEVIVIDDGSTDKTVEVAKKYGVKHFVRHAQNQGLAYSFRDGIRKSLEIGGDIIVITDGDNQYPQDRIPDLIQPILDARADIVIADRQTSTIEHFTPSHKILQKVGTWVLNKAAGTNIPDGTSGFRAFTKDAAISLNLVTRYSFGMETIIQAGNKKQTIATIVIKTNPKTRESRLFKSPWQHARRQAVVIMRSFMMYKPYSVFLWLGGVLFIGGIIPFIHYLYLDITTNHANGAHHLQSLIIGTVLLIAAFIAFTLGFVADLIRINRSLIEDVLEGQRRMEYSNEKDEKTPSSKA